MLMQIVITLFITIAILLSISIYFLIKKSILKYIIPIIGIVFSLILIGLSFFIDSWKSIGIDTFGFAIFIGSAISFVVIAIIVNIIELRKSIG